MKSIVVIGSLNMDLVTHVHSLPKAGETLSSIKFLKNPGGKGANQAVAAAKLGSTVSMIGSVGADDYGTELINGLRASGVNVEGVSRCETTETGMAFINVNSAGENNIVLVPGSNNKVSTTLIDEMIPIIEEHDLIILQLEIPIHVVEYVITLAQKLNKKVILNPAPALEISSEALRGVDTLIPNETELHLLTAMPVETMEDIEAGATYLRKLGVRQVIVTLGAGGSFLMNETDQIHLPALDVKQVDTTGAGDAYVAALSVGLSKGLTDIKAAKLANEVAALVVTHEGAQTPLPTIEEIIGI